MCGAAGPTSYYRDGLSIPGQAYFFVDLLGFNDGVFPGVSLLSRRR